MKQKTLLLIPEIYLLCATLTYWFFTTTLFNPIAIGLLIIIIFQIVSKNKITGLAIGSLFLILNFYMVLALISELKEFLEPNKMYYNLLVFGAIFIGINILMSSLILWKHLSIKTKKELYIANS